jgi:hypothetical protein
MTLYLTLLALASAICWAIMPSSDRPHVTAVPQSEAGGCFYFFAGQFVLAFFGWLFFC